MAPATPADYSSMLMLLQRLNNNNQLQQQQQQQQQQLANNNPPNLSTLNAAATLAMIAQQQQQLQSRNSADNNNNNNNATESLLMLAVQQLQQQQQQQQAQKCLIQWRQQFSAEINNNNNKNDLDQKSTFLSSPYQHGVHHSHSHHAPLQHSLSANTVLVHGQDGAGGGYGSGDLSPPLAPAASTPRSAGDSTQLLFSATTSDCGAGAETPRTSATVGGSDEKPKRRSRLGGTSLKTAKVWRFFTQLPHPEQAATCQLCSKIIKATNSSTTGMIRHLRSCHPAEHKIVEDERRITLVQKTLKNVTSDVERAQLMQSYNAMAAAGGGTPSAEAMSSLLNQLNGTPSSPSASAARQPPTTPLSSMTAFRHYSQQDDFKFAPSDATSSPLMEGPFGGRYLNQMLKLLTKTPEPSAFNSTSTTLEQFEQFKANLVAQQSELVTQLNDNDENNNKTVGTKPDDSGIGEHNDSEEDDEAPTRRVQPVGSTVATISPQIGATAVTTPTKAQSGSDATNKHFGSTTAATAEDFTAAAAAAQTTTILADLRQMDDQEELRNDSTFSPVREDEDEPRDDEDDGNEDAEEDDEECVKTDGALIKPSPVFMRNLPIFSDGQTSSQRGVKRQFVTSSSSTWDLSKPMAGGWTQQQAKQLNEQIALMLLIDGASVSIVDRVGFRELIRSLCPEHVMPSVEVFQREIIPALPARLGCDFATFRERLQHNNPLTSSDFLGDLTSDYSIADGHTGKLSPVDMSESGFQDCEDVENRSPPLPMQQQKPAIGSGSLTMLSAQSLYAFDAKRARAHSPPMMIVKSEPMETAIVGINTGADDSALSSLSGGCSPPSSATDTNNNVDSGAAVLTA